MLLTAKDSVEDRVSGLTVGGDDYVTKPFSIEELVARLRGLLRRAGMTAARHDPALVVGDLRLDEDSHEVRCGDTPVELTATEFELLRFLMRNPKRVLSKPQILDRVWHTTSAASPTSSSSTSPTCARRSTPAGAGTSCAPRSPIRGYAKLTRRAPLAPEAEYSIARISSQTERMTALVEDLLLLARLDAGRPLERGPVDLTRLVLDGVNDAYAAGIDHR